MDIEMALQSIDRCLFYRCDRVVNIKKKDPASSESNGTVAAGEGINTRRSR